mmetsp:Transcript_28369/g.56783  ORF Transcript_28369/g.56783 Transcript_28369/m.56783 type:complete len:610 (+) Transcript_28369:52-1881(+)|eukprot:CAMPEP_0194306676 /NCGR_PEP_ID=MMETSP0171-20130528/3735_1 /TAXON_ID=218684 /ORGANISM="Corethron pennatum, Strain L29A3" /LENGTH=609 /DNA_ID=CAMNT_0039058505 /DNA_START=31 /DNA_END=1860 /DNA_ORIENTATION=+
MDVEYGSGKIKLLVVITAFCLLHSGSAFCLPSGLVGNGNTFGRQLRSSGNPLGHSFFDLLAVSTNEETDDGSVIESIEFPAPLTGPQQLARSAEFWKSAVPIIASYYKAAAKLKFRQDVLGECISEEEECQVWNDLHETGAQNLADTITSLKGFYVKTAQIISSREDLFPKQYTDALAGFTDDLDPMPGALVKAVIVQELLNRDEVFEDVFTEFDDIPLGSASIGQVHRAILSEKYGGPKEVAVKVQRPAIESKLLGDIANLITITKPLKEADALPLDYYAVFCELEKQLADEFDFVAEASAMDRIYKALARSPDGSKARDLPLKIPRPVPGLISRRVLVMDYLKGVPLSRARDEMIKKGIDPDGPESKIFGRRLLKSLTEVFGRSILETGFFHADPHPGNIFVLEDGSIGLIDFGQVKQISGRSRETLAKVMIALNNRESDSNPSDLKTIGDLALELGVTFKPDIKDEAPAAVAMWLFDGTVENLPGGYDKGELSPNSPVKDLESFPQDLVLVGRSSILIKGLSNRLGIPWSLAAEWAPIAEKVLALSSKGGGDVQQGVRFLDVLRILKTWTKGKVSLGASRLPPPIRKRVATLAVKIQERRERRQNR